MYALILITVSTSYISGYKSFATPLDGDLTSNLTVVTSLGGSQGYAPGVSNMAAALVNEGLLITAPDNKCLGSLAHCFFGLTLGMWVKVKGESFHGSRLLLLELGGDTSMNQTGVTIMCENATGEMNSVQCRLSLVNHTTAWKCQFYLQLEEWVHLTVVWNPFRNLILYKNGHDLTELGVTVTMEIIQFDNVDDDNSWRNATHSICIGCSVVDASYVLTHSLLIDEVYMLDMDVTTTEVRHMYGKDSN